MRRVRIQFRLLDIYRIMQDGNMDNIANIKDIKCTGCWLKVTITDVFGNLYSTEYCNIDTLVLRKEAVKKINKRLKEAVKHA